MFDKINSIISGLTGKTGLGMATLAVSYVLTKMGIDANAGEVAGAAGVIIGLIHKVIKARGNKAA